MTPEKMDPHKRAAALARILEVPPKPKPSEKPKKA